MTGGGLRDQPEPRSSSLQTLGGIGTGAGGAVSRAARDHAGAGARRLLAERDIRLSTGAMWNAVRRLGLSFKKKALHAAEQTRPDVAACRTLLRAAQPFIAPESLVFLDDSGVNTKMARLYGWAPVGERCRDRMPFGHWKTMTFIAGLRLTGMTAPWVLDGPMCGDTFQVYVRDVLAPTFRRGDVVVLDNLPAHKVPGIREAITARRA